jgi:spore maturation protein CgeB
MRILYTLPSLQTVYSARFVYEGLRNAFVDLGHDFRAYTADDDLGQLLARWRPDLFFYGLHFYHLKFVDLDLLERQRKEGLTVFCQIRAWHQHTTGASTGSPGASGLKEHRRLVDLITSGKAGDVFWHFFEQDEPLMDGFTERTGRSFETIHLAADATLYYPEPDERFECDLAYVGSYLPAKRQFFRETLLPLRQRYDLRIYGSDWTLGNRLLGHIQRLGQYFNVRPLKGIRKLPLTIRDERRLYSSARICLNVHEEQVRRTGSEINERVFKILACGGFQLCDNVSLIRRFFTDSELVMADERSDWENKVQHYLRHPEERRVVAEAGRRKVLAEHTYHHRAKQILDIARRYGGSLRH